MDREHLDHLLAFVSEHQNDDPIRLRLQFTKKELSFDLNFALEQIESRKRCKEKLPIWDHNPQMLFPAKICLEQASSQLTALYKQKLLKGTSVVDLTGGLGMDTIAFAKTQREITYIEREAHYVQVAEYNFQLLNLPITVVHTTCEQFLNDTSQQFDTLYIDPARRGKENSRVFAFSDCQPNVLELMPIMRKKSKRLLIKASPMIDVKHSLRELPFVSQVHILSVKNDCKELIFVLDFEKEEITANSPTIYTCNFTDRQEQLFQFTFEEEDAIQINEFANELSLYLYEPNAAVMKSGAFKGLVQHYGVKKLHPNTHLYTSDKIVDDFPGRKFRILETFPFESKRLKELKKSPFKANLSVRNFPLAPKELQKKLAVIEGGETTLYGTTLGNNAKVLIHAEPIRI